MEDWHIIAIALLGGFYYIERGISNLGKGIKEGLIGLGKEIKEGLIHLSDKK